VRHAQAGRFRSTRFTRRACSGGRNPVLTGARRIEAYSLGELADRAKRDRRMSKVAVVAYSKLEDSDRRWIESVRAQHDPQARLIRAHFPVVFPAEASPDVVVGNTAAVCRRSRQIPFSLRHARAVREVVGVGDHVILLLEGGRAALVALHRRLHDGAILGQLRAGMRFAPHITVATYAGFERCAALAQELEVAGRTVGGTVDRLEVVALSSDGVESLATLPLGGHA
jgi:hypothetical protein